VVTKGQHQGSCGDGTIWYVESGSGQNLEHVIKWQRRKCTHAHTHRNVQMVPIYDGSTL
jgi:hypothetical protein